MTSTPPLEDCLLSTHEMLPGRLVMTASCAWTSRPIKSLGEPRLCCKLQLVIFRPSAEVLAYDRGLRKRSSVSKYTRTQTGT